MHLPDASGTYRIKSSASAFVVTGITSAAIGAAISWAIYEYTGFKLLSYSILTVFGFWSLRAIIQGLFVPAMLTIEVSPDAIRGPKLWWFENATIPFTSIDWSQSGVIAGRLIVQSTGAPRIYTRLSWYGPNGSNAIRTMWDDIVSRYSWRDHGAV